MDEKLINLNNPSQSKEAMHSTKAFVPLLPREMDKKYYDFMVKKMQQKQRMYKVMCGNPNSAMPLTDRTRTSP